MGFYFSNKDDGNVATHLGCEACGWQSRERLRRRLGVEFLVFLHQTHSDLAVDLEAFLAQNAAFASEAKSNLVLTILSQKLLQIPRFKLSTLRKNAAKTAKLTNFFNPNCLNFNPQFPRIFELNADADAVFTTLRGVGVCVMVADCAPVLLTSATHAAAIHAGRRGVFAKILSKTLGKMGAQKGVKAAIGPHICAKCYEVKGVDCAGFEAFKKGDFLDLGGALLAEFDAKGVKEVESVLVCTHCGEGFFSYRNFCKNKERADERFCGVAWL